LNDEFPEVRMKLKEEVRKQLIEYIKLKVTPVLPDLKLGIDALFV
jgi:hypothetical protein